MIIDCHCHAGKGDILTAPWNSDAPLESYLRRARAAGIDRTVVFAVFHTDYDRANAQVASIVASHPDRLIGFAFVHASRDAGRVLGCGEIFTERRQAGRCGHLPGPLAGQQSAARAAAHDS